MSNEWLVSPSDKAGPFRVRVWHGQKQKGTPDFEAEVQGFGTALSLLQIKIAEAILLLPTVDIATGSVLRANGNIVAAFNLGMPYLED